MKENRTKPFSATRSVVQRGTVAMLCAILSCLTFFSGCKKDKPNGIKEPEYPIDIQFTEYTLSNTCQWKNLAYDNTVFIINSNEELQQHITSIDGIYPEIDFTTHTLLVASGKTDNSIFEISINNLIQLSENEYELNIEISLKMAAIVKEWEVAILVEKVSEESKVSLKTSINEPEFTLKGTTWKLVGFVDAETGVLKEAEPIGCIRCYTLEFNTDTTLFTTSQANDIWGKYEVDYTTNSIRLFDVCGTFVGEQGDGGLYYDVIQYEIKSFHLQKNELWLYYNDKKNYLKFISKEGLLSNTHWKLTGFMDMGSGEIRPPEPAGEDVFLLSFDSYFFLKGFTSTNNFEGRYLFWETSSNFYTQKIHKTTHFDESPDGDLFFIILQSLISSFLLQGNELKLFYRFPDSEMNCLIFKKTIKP